MADDLEPPPSATAAVPPGSAPAATDPLAGLFDERLGLRARLVGLTGGLLPWPPAVSRRTVVLAVAGLVLAAAVGVVLGVARHGDTRVGSSRVELDLPMAAPAAGRTATGAGGPTARTTGTGDAGVPGTTAGPATVVVAAAGAVVQPGLYRVPEGARVADVIAAAGGLDPNADVDRINLAAPVRDGERVYVPRRDQAEVPPVVAGSGTSPGPGGGVGTAGSAGVPGAPPRPVNVNTAGVDELDELPGVGPSTAAAIVADRSANGPFTSVDDLARVRGIGPAKLEQLRPLVTV